MKDAYKTGIKIMAARVDIIQKLIVTGPVAGVRLPSTTVMASVEGTTMGEGERKFGDNPENIDNRIAKWSCASYTYSLSNK